MSSLAPDLDDLRRAVSPEGRTQLAGLAGRHRADRDLSDVTLLAPLHPEARIFCVGKNFRDHAAEVGGEEPSEPRVFLRTHQSLVGPGGRLSRPITSNQFDYEGEVALVIGTPTTRVPEGDALAHVAAYTCFNDGSVRDFQQHTTTAGKNFDGSGAIGPWLVTSDEIGDPSDLELTTTLNGDEVQAGSLRQLIYPIPTIVSYLSSITTLLPGDVVSLGTPAGVGKSRTPPRWLQEGDTLQVEAPRIGVLEMVVTNGGQL